MKNKITLYRDLINIDVNDFGEDFVFLASRCQQNIWCDFWTQVEWKIIIRETVSSMLKKANFILEEKTWNNNLEISVICWYILRSLVRIERTRSSSSLK